MSVFLFGLSTILLYTIGTVLQWGCIKNLSIPKYTVLLVIFLGLIIHGVWLTQRVFLKDGIILNFLTMYSLCSWVITVIVFFSSLKKPLENIFIVLLPCVILGIINSWLFNGPRDIIPRPTAGILFHIIISILAYSVLTIASLQAFLFAYQERKIRHRAPQILRVFPPMETMEHLLFKLIMFGMILLTLSLASGFIYLNELIPRHLSHKSILAIGSWLVFGILLAGHYLYGWRGRRASQWTIAGFLLLILSYFGSKIISDMLWY